MVNTNLYVTSTKIKIEVRTKLLSIQNVQGQYFGALLCQQNSVSVKSTTITTVSVKSMPQHNNNYIHFIHTGPINYCDSMHSSCSNVIRGNGDCSGQQIQLQLNGRK